MKQSSLIISVLDLKNTFDVLYTPISVSYLNFMLKMRMYNDAECVFQKLQSAAIVLRTAATSTYVSGFCSKFAKAPNIYVYALL